LAAFAISEIVMRSGFAINHQNKRFCFYHQRYR
jgi:hypothetical protein